MRRTGERRVSKLRTVAVALVCCNQVQPCLALAGDGGVCPSPYDTDCNGLVDGADLARVLASWGAPSNTCDFNGDCMVGSADLGQLLAAWGPVVESGQSDAGFFVEGREVSICLGEEIGNITAVIDGYYVPNDSSGLAL